MGETDRDSPARCGDNRSAGFSKIQDLAIAALHQKEKGALNETSVGQRNV